VENHALKCTAMKIKIMSIKDKILTFKIENAKKTWTISKPLSSFAELAIKVINTPVNIDQTNSVKTVLK